MEKKHDCDLPRILLVYYVSGCLQGKSFILSIILSTFPLGYQAIIFDRKSFSTRKSDSQKDAIPIIIEVFTQKKNADRKHYPNIFHGIYANQCFFTL